MIRVGIHDEIPVFLPARRRCHVTFVTVKENLIKGRIALIVFVDLLHPFGCRGKSRAVIADKASPVIQIRPYVCSVFLSVPASFESRQLGEFGFVILMRVVPVGKIVDPFFLVCFIRDGLLFGCGIQIHLVPGCLIVTHGIRQLCYFVLIIGVFDFSDLLV